MHDELTVLIAEDELLIRMGIKLSCDWEKLGMRIVGDAADGETAWTAYLNLKPDIVLMDIRMPGIDGVELARRIRKTDGLCRLIAISCVDEFSTLHQLTHLGITDYLLKLDMTPESLSAALQKARTEWTALRPNPEEPRPTPASVPAFEAQYLFALYSEALSSAGCDMLLATLEKILSEHMPGPLNCRLQSEGVALCLAGPLSNINFQTQLTRVQAHFHRIFSLPLSILGMKIHSGQAVDAAFAELNRLYEKGYWFCKPVARWSPNSEWIALEKQKNLTFYSEKQEMLSGIPKSAQSILAQQIPLLPLNSIVEFQNALMSLTLNLVLRSLRLPVRDIGQAHAAVTEAPSAWAALEACVQFIEQQIYQSLGTRVKRPEIRRALEYIGDHFGESLSSSQVAEQVGLSAHYFLNVFKKETGMTFVGYLNHYRIEQAKSLLEETGLYAYEIASRCGFSDAAYFSRIFKQITGVHPRHYRQSGEEERP